MSSYLYFICSEGLCCVPSAMAHHWTLRSLLVFHGLVGICTGFVQENCTNVTQKRVFSVPGDVAMLNGTLESSHGSNLKGVPYNITWYNSSTGQEMNNLTGRILVLREILWFLKVTPEDHGIYSTILRTPFQCFRQDIKLSVDQPAAKACGRPKTTPQYLTKGSNGMLSCPLGDYIKKLKSYNISSTRKWYKGCDLIEPETGRYSFDGATRLRIKRVGPEDSSSFTCTLTFTLGGITGSVSETIKAVLTEDYIRAPWITEPTNRPVKAQIGSKLSIQCLAFVPFRGKNPSVQMTWSVREGLISWNRSHRVYSPKKSSERRDVPEEGYLFTQLLVFSKLREEDFHLNYTCQVNAGTGQSHQRYFTLLPPDPNIILPIGLVFGGMFFFFITSVIIHYLFKVDIVLWFRRVFPALYPNQDLDDKLYDAYVAYPQPSDSEFSVDVEKFALHTLPKVLEEACGYQLFIAGRDCAAGQAVVDSVEKNLQASRRVLLLYAASTFISKRHTRSPGSNKNNTTSRSRDCSRNNESGSTDFESDKEVYSDTRQQFECVAAMHRALLEGSLKVVLVELEEISPAQLALFPESVRQLRKKQGAVCWWKNLGKRQSSQKFSKFCIRRREDEERGGQDTQLSPSLSPSSRFWKEMRYHMPVKGTRRGTGRTRDVV
ncbi:interleukin-1 receptor-like 2 [Notolabrus celidotus]|uniref:interleukin-1 receptor-like 2 n=1 Tax=Notolabrus celidotus TaxID=1203425 RepID=UPI0014900755|nr:interleukin-1 receptor-like 2 [Notolabrus celidotus]